MLKILIVGDNRWFRKSLRELLQSRHPDMQIVTAADGTEVGERLDALEPDVVFMDIRLPGGNGIELTREILLARPHLPVVIMTSHDEVEYREAARTAGAAHILPKDELSPRHIDSIMESLWPQSASHLVKKLRPRRFEDWAASVARRISPSMLAVVLVSALLGLSIPIVLRPMRASAPSPYRVLATAGSMGHFMKNDVLVVFADEVPEGEVTSLLRSLRGRIVDGPSKRRVYTVRIGDNEETADQAIAEALAHLRANKGVLLAEPALVAGKESPYR